MCDRLKEGSLKTSELRALAISACKHLRLSTQEIDDMLRLGRPDRPRHAEECYLAIIRSYRL